MSELGDSLERMSFMQLLLLFAFVTSYVLAVGGLLGGPARRRMAGLAVLLAAGFAALTDPWVHGALLAVFVVAGLGLFVMLSWLLVWMLGPRQTPSALAAETGTPVPSSMFRTDDAAEATPKLPARARTRQS